MKVIHENIEIIKKHFAKHILKMRKENNLEKFRRTKFQVGLTRKDEWVITGLCSFYEQCPDTNYNQFRRMQLLLYFPRELLDIECLNKVVDDFVYERIRRPYDNNILIWSLKLKGVGEQLLQEV